MSLAMENNLLLIGGSSRNVGKTTFAVKIIEKFAREHQIVGLKIKTVYVGDDFFHGKDRSPLTSDYRLVEEMNSSSNEDTAKMLKAGAKRAFKLKVKSDAILQAFESFKGLLKKPNLIVCESNSLRWVINPAIYLLIKQKGDENMKPSAIELEKYADKIVYTDGEKHNFSLDDIVVKDSRWYLKS